MGTRWVSSARRGAPVLVVVDQWGKRQLSRGQVLRGEECRPRSRGEKPDSGWEEQEERRGSLC